MNKRPTQRTRQVDTSEPLEKPPTPPARRRGRGIRMTAAQRVEAKAAYLEGYKKTGIVGSGLEAAGIGRTTLKAWRDADPAFDAACDEALETGNDVIRSRIYHLGVIGIKRVRRRFWKGELIDEETWVEYNTPCLLALARSRMAEFRDSDAAAGAADPLKMMIGFDVERV